MMTQVSQDSVITELENTRNLCQKLMQTPHYAKMGEVGIYAVVNKAKSMGMNPLDALNGGMYCVQGKVEMSGQSMLALIRSKGHSVSMDPKSTDTKVIMFGKRCDNGDSWRAEFSIEDAKKQGIYRNQWEKMPRVMCMWRCVSQLGRFLFSDILHGVYVQGEISDSPSFDSKVSYETEETKIESFEIVSKPQLTKEQVDVLEEVLSQCSKEYNDTVKDFMKNSNIKDLYSIPLNTYTKLLAKSIAKKTQEHEQELQLINEGVVNE